MEDLELNETALKRIAEYLKQVNWEGIELNIPEDLEIYED